MVPGFPVPDGFVRHETDGCVLIADRRLLSELIAAGLDRPDGWITPVKGAASQAGRGTTRRWATSDGAALVLKQLRRGGLVGRMWRDRHLGNGRLIRNLTIPAEARRRGVATPAVVAVLCVRGPVGLWRGWLAVDALDGEDLLARLRRGVDAGLDDARSALRAVRRAHEAGLEHPDLNLGNLFIDVEGGAHVIDLDGARLRDRVLGIGRRSRELLRLERSWLRNLGPRGPRGEGVAAWIEAAYAGEDSELARRLGSRRALGSLALAVRGLNRRGGSG